MQRIVFSSAELPAHLGNRARFSLWRDLYTTRYGLLDLQRSDDRPFSASFEFAQFGGVGLGQFKGTVNRVARTRREVAEVPSDNFCLVVNRGGSVMSFAHRGREAALRPGAATLFNDAEPGALRGAAENAWFALVVPRRQLLELVVDAEDSSGRPFDPSLPAVRHLRRYLDLLLEPDGVGEEPALLAHAGRTLADLVALALGAGPRYVKVWRLSAFTPRGVPGPEIDDPPDTTLFTKPTKSVVGREIIARCHRCGARNLDCEQHEVRYLSWLSGLPAASIAWRRLENARSTCRGIAATRKLSADLSTT